MKTTKTEMTEMEMIANSLDGIAFAIDRLASAVEGSYDGQSTSALWGISQALFMAVGQGDSQYDRGSLKIKIQKDDE